MITIMRSQLSRSTRVPKGARGRTKPVLAPDYIAGLTDGEGCFYVQIRTSSRYHFGHTVHLHFHIKMQADDKVLLDKVKDTLGCGNVYFQSDNRPTHRQCYRYSVSSHSDILQIVIPFFKEHRLQSPSKLKNFELFVQIANLVEVKAHLTKSGIEQIQKIKAQMNQVGTGLA
jgi:hypothetical protein